MRPSQGAHALNTAGCGNTGIDAGLTEAADSSDTSRYPSSFIGYPAQQHVRGESLRAELQPSTM